MFENWENFYLLIGSASGALIGLLFVVVTLTAGYERDKALRGSSLFMTPTVTLFTTAMLIGALATAPKLSVAVQGALIGMAAAAGLIYGLTITFRLFWGDGKSPHWTDPWCYGAIPAATYAVLGAAAVCVWAAPGWAAYVLALAAIAMLVTGIRNAWDLITWMAPGRDGAASPPEA